MALNVAQKLIEEHLVDGEMTPGREIGLRIDQTLTQDATGTMVMLELEAMGLDRVRTGVSVRYVDHNLLQARRLASALFPSSTRCLRPLTCPSRSRSLMTSPPTRSCPQARGPCPTAAISPSSLISRSARITIRNASTGDSYQARHGLSARQRQIVLAGGQIPLLAS